jgi:hypothetical protein
MHVDRDGTLIARRRARISAALGHRLPFDAKIVRQTDAQDSVWPFSFERRSVANTNANGEHQTPSWTPSRGMSIRAVERKDPKISNAIRC